MFDTLIRDVAGHLGLPQDKAQGLLSSLVSMIFDRNSGGFAGFIDRFKQAGLEDTIGSWIGGGAGAKPIEADQVSRAIGSGTVSSLASKLDLPGSAVTGGLAMLLPKVVGALTPGGTIPTAPPAALGSLIGGVTSTVRSVGSSAAGAASQAARDVSQVTGGGLGWLKWAVLAAIILLLGYCVLHRPTTSETATPAPAASTAAAPAATIPTPASKPATSTTAASAPVPASTTSAPAPASTANAAMPATATTTPTAASASSAAPDAGAALAALKPGAFSADDLLKALNLMSIQFDTGSARINASSDEILGKAADAIKQAPADLRIEVGGYTDNVGNAALNLKLSDARATAVRERLIKLGVKPETLVAKGYGEAQPIADNGTAEGRARNRRMQFSLLK